MVCATFGTRYVKVETETVQVCVTNRRELASKYTESPLSGQLNPDKVVNTSSVVSLLGMRRARSQPIKDLGGLCSLVFLMALDSLVVMDAALKWDCTLGATTGVTL